VRRGGDWGRGGGVRGRGGEGIRDEEGDKYGRRRGGGGGLVGKEEWSIDGWKGRG